ncbi:MAG TPA: hypothetical protein VLH15_04240 [Dehalococcoidales bacterium]|nr:hypothetical protein [Dehalococcoidales bacterium]
MTRKWAKKEKQVRDGKGFFKFENPGEELEGYLVGMRQVDTKYGLATVADIAGDGEEPNTVIITAGMDISDADLDHYVKIVFKGWQKNPNSGNVYKQFEVFLAEDTEVIDADVPF